MEIIREFFGFGGYERVPEGAYSWQHLTCVILGFLIAVGIAIFLGLKFRNAEEKKKNLVLVWTAIIIDFIEISKIIIVSIRLGDPLHFLYDLPLFLCSIQLIAIPVAAFSSGRVKESTLDFIFIFGVLGAVLGTVGASQNFDAYPVLSLDNVVNCLTHLLAGFAAIYIGVSGMTSMKKKNLPIVMGILSVFCVLAFTMNFIVDYNYMFLVRSDGTPYQILYDLVGGNPVLYPLCVVLLFFVYIGVFNFIYHLILNKMNKKAKTPADEA